MSFLRSHLSPSSASGGLPTSPPPNVNRPPHLLTTALGPDQGPYQDQTPQSTTSLSSPFSLHQSSAYPASPPSAARGDSPMAARGQAGFNAPYNPQQWGPVSGSSRNPSGGTAARPARYAPRLTGPDEPVASPPPPYSPRRDPGPEPSPRTVQETISPSDTISPATDHSHYGTPISAATTMSPDCSTEYPSQMLQLQGVPLQNDHIGTCSTPAFPPPPGITSASAARHRALSKSRADRILSTLSSRTKSNNDGSPTSAIDALQESTSQAIARAPQPTTTQSTVRPPASRRAASTGGIGMGSGPSRTASQSPSRCPWEPGMPLPPPPPGPPPSSTRSQSLNRPPELHSSDRPVAISRTKKPPGTGTVLAPVPPTPADWREDASSTCNTASSSRSHHAKPLHIDTSTVLRDSRRNVEELHSSISANPYSAHLQRESSSGGLARSPAVRNRSAKGIRERRSESRNGKGRISEISNDIHSSTITMSPDSLDEIKPTDLVLPFEGRGLSSRRTANRVSPKAGQNMLSLNGALKSPRIQSTFDQDISFKSPNPTTQLNPQPNHQGPTTATPSPPFSPSRTTFNGPSLRPEASPSLPPKSPLTPPQHPKEGSLLSSGLLPPLVDQRPISHILHIPNPDGSIQAPLIPSTNTSTPSAVDLMGPESPTAFAQRAMERHRQFSEREAAARSDVERLQLFSQYMVAESRIRRERYARVFEDAQISTEALVQGLFEPVGSAPCSSEDQQETQRSEHSPLQRSRASSFSASGSESNRQRSSSVVSWTHESPNSNTTESSSHNRPESTWWKDYIPSLSPIASMSITTGQDNDEMGSRGRASSRWWEDRSGESAQGDEFKVLQRSKRESKYMGLPVEVRNSPALFESRCVTSNSLPPRYIEETSQQPQYGPDEYPPEKVAGHQQISPLPPPPPLPPTPRSAPYTPDPRKLDVSRLVTLPPPYPRHHPAVNNNHPDLADIRAVVRSLQETDEINNIKNSYQEQIQEKRQRAKSWCLHQRSLHDQDVHFRLERNDISQAEFDQVELEIEGKIAKSDRDIAQKDFDLFQSVVISPLHAILSNHVTKATQSIQDLSSRLFSETQKHSPNMPQEEGDEQPELLEKLTQLKWLFEARESLHRKIFDLLTERNDKYKKIVLLPYQQTQNLEKHAEAESFFGNDARERQSADENAAAARFDAFLAVIEANVTRGVEIQLSAFWDIAPPLNRVLTRIPPNLQGFEIQIPQAEYEENPSYYEHPMQYLYSLLEHAQKSSYQFIESQINLLCLLHEIKCGAMRARFHAQELAGQAVKNVVEARGSEEGRLDDELKDKVEWVEAQWREALGEEMMSVRERVREHLLEHGGWDEGLES
ncbi:MAG: hypothetical protein LQ351_001823 [Letrouitia transgressa]|nr:MAG: hypothetical protein LQ351_001823 [Letrouitia transgressa]